MPPLAGDRWGRTISGKACPGLCSAWKPGRSIVLTVDIALPEVEELQKLVQDGQEKGFLTYDEIVAGLEEVELTKEQIEDFYTYMIDHGIKLMEGETHKAPPPEQTTPEDQNAAAPQATATLDL